MTHIMRVLKKPIKYSVLILLLFSAFFGLFSLYSCGSSESLTPGSEYPVMTQPSPSQGESSVPETSERVVFLSKKITSGINSRSAILVDLDSGLTIAEKDAEERIFPASTTKILTSIIVIEYYSSLSTGLDTEIEMPEDMYSYLWEQNAAQAGFVAGEKVKVIDLLYGVLLPSGADACLALARAVAGDEVRFASLMNSKAKEIGANNSNFVTCTGLHDRSHYTTVKDLSVIFRYALNNETFRKIVTTTSHRTSPTNKHPNGLLLSSTVFAAIAKAGIENKYIKGGKTGYTDEAKLCLATLANVNGNEYILVTVGAGDYGGTEHVRDAVTIYGTYCQ